MQYTKQSRDIKRAHEDGNMKKYCLAVYGNYIISHYGWRGKHSSKLCMSAKIRKKINEDLKKKTFWKCQCSV